MQSVPVVVFTCDSYLNLIPAFSYLFNTYWSSLQKVFVVGYTPPTFKLPDNFIFASMADENIPSEFWTDSAKQFLSSLDSEYAVILLDDYFLIRTMDVSAVSALTEYMIIQNDVMRMDLVDDRQFSGTAFAAGHWGHFDLIETPGDSPYQLSLQPAIWNIPMLLEIMGDNMSPWEFEMESQHIHEMEGHRVLGTKQCPLQYSNTVGMGRGTIDEPFLDEIPEDHIAHVKELLKNK